MGQWQQWVDKHNLNISPQQRSPFCIELARLDLDAITEPMPREIQWVSHVQRGEFIQRRDVASGTLLEFFLAVGDMGLYGGFDESRSKCRPDVLDLGDALVARGALPSARMVEAALLTGLWNLDGPNRLDAAFRWGAASAWDPQAALSACCENSVWDENGGAACFAILEREGALQAPGVDFKSCIASRHPIVKAAVAGDTKTIARLIERGVSVDWQDPDTGATLWHMASSLSAAVGKALFPALSRSAAGLAGAVCSSDVSIVGQRSGGLKIRKGQTPLHCACDGVKPAALSAALDCGAPADHLDSRGDSPLTLLSRRWGARAQAKGEPMAKALLLAGADPGRKDKKGLTAAQNMAAKGPLGALAALLEQRPQDVGASDPRAKEAFAKLAERGSEGAARAESAAMTIATGAGASTKAPRGRKLAL